MKTPSRIVTLIAAILIGGAAAAQVSETRAYRVQFPAGSTGATLRDTITGYESVVYRLSARAGQAMTITLSASNSSTYFNVYGPGRGPGDRALATSDIMGPMVPGLNRFQGQLPETGDYRISVYQFRSAARRGERSSFTLQVNITGGAAQLPGGPPVANGDPAFWRITGLTPGDRLNVRSGPSTSYRVIDRLASGEIVRNRGCSLNPSGTRWCQINRIGQPGNTGWASARYLTAAREPAGGATQLPGDALVPGTGFNATGQISCTIDGRARQCDFGVVRRGNGDGTLTITMPGGARRNIEFLAGRPVSSNSPAGIFGEWSGDDVTVFIGTYERYVVPNAVLFGG
ncbi:SH3 domain-containing protein [Ostreiculturibacter nitratireducens]|uniref:SH3 domain-containing protein n=1 Tax=Ostreiculturibacter nitratireducens TaxID=3075226 RepID=UPI0031B5B3BB